MKKVLFGLFALSTVAFASETNVYFKAGLDFNSKFDTFNYEGFDYSKEDADGTGYEFAVEVTREVVPNLELGFGLAYQDHDKPESVSDGYIWTYKDGSKDYNIDTYQLSNFESVPLYLTAKYTIPVDWVAKPYIKADLGYSFNSCDNVELGWTEYEMKGDTITNNVTNSSSGELSTDIDDGIYYGIGVGIEYENLVAELMYKVNTADIKVNTTDDNDQALRLKRSYDYSRVTLSFGYKFNF